MSIPYTYIIAEKDGKQVKIPYNEFADSFVTYTSEPASPNTEGGQQGMFSASAWSTITGTESTSSSAYVYSNNAWRKIPTYTTNWDDLEAVTNEDDTISYLRFLPVHKSVELTEKEIDIARKNIDVTIATNEHPGLVKGSNYSDMYGGINVAEDGALQATLASTVHAGAVILIGDLGSDPDNPTVHLPQVYSKQAIDSKFTQAGAWIIPLATPEIIGGIKIGEHLHIADQEQLTVDKAYVQEQPQYGIVRFAPSNYDPFDDDPKNSNAAKEDANGPYVLSAEQTELLINHIVSQGVISVITVPKATNLTLGGVKIDSSQSNIVFNSADVIYVTDATDEKAGVVKISDKITDNDKENSKLNIVPTLKAVADYLTTTTAQVPLATAEIPGIVRVGPNLTIQDDGILGVKFPLASFSQNTAGIVNITNTLTGNINSTLVPTTQAVSDYVIQKIEQTIETPTVPSANAVHPGVVLVNPTQSDNLVDNTYTVPTVEKTIELIDESLERYTDSQSVLRCRHWVVLGTGSFTQEAVDIATNDNELPTAIVVSQYSRVTPAEEDEDGNPIGGGVALSPGINLFKFSSEVSIDTVQILLDSMVEQEVGYYDNNFLIMPATAGIGSFLK